MIDKETNRMRVKQHRLKRLSEGYKQIKVFLSPRTFEMLDSLRNHYLFDRRRTGAVLSRIIEEDFKKINDL